jgi:DNA-binding transcriptional ArsR family regulator
VTIGSRIVETVDLVFKALADRGRRSLLDSLFERDGQTLAELCRVLPDLTRFGVMKHLDVLAKANLVLAHRVGREKFHYLNPVPIAEIHDRWVGKYAAPFVSALSALKRDLEDLEGNDRGQTATSA